MNKGPVITRGEQPLSCFTLLRVFLGFAMVALWPLCISAAGATTVEQRITTSKDDAEEFSDGTMYLGSSDLELTHDASDQTVGMRWPGIAIPRGAIITAAYIQFSAKASQSVVTSLTIRGQAADNPPAFCSTARDISSRPRTGAAATWAPVPWAAGEVGANQRTPDLSALVQEIVNRPGWTSGNALAIIITGTGHRTAWACNGSASGAPLLHVDFGGGTAPPPASPPVAKLSVTQVPTPALTVAADASASTATTPIASYKFDFGDGTSPIITSATSAAATTLGTTATATPQHTYANVGTYTVSLTVTDTGGSVSAPATQSITVTAAGGPKVAIYAGYYDTHHPSNPRPKPNPWKGSSGVLFVGKPDGSSGGWDTSALRIDNLTGGSLAGVTATVDIGSEHYSLWGQYSVPAGGTLILAQTSIENFDGSDTNPAGCYSCSPQYCLTKVSSTIPVVHVSIGGVKTDYFDVLQVLNTLGVDAAGCPYTGTRNDESEAWHRIYSTPPAAPLAASSLGGAENPASASTPESRFWLGPPYPNPTQGELAVRFETATRGAVRLRVYDVTGRLVRMCVDDVLDAGTYMERVDLNGVATGIYFFNLQTPEGSRHQAFVFMRHK